MREVDGTCGFLMWGAALLVLAFMDGVLLGALVASVLLLW